MIISKDYENQLIEKIAELEHNQWWEWSTVLADRIKKWIKHEEIEFSLEINLNNQIKKWEKNWNFYKFLNEETKECDRIYARKIIALLKQEGIIKNDNNKHKQQL